MKQNISINNGTSYITADELTDSQVRDILDYINGCKSEASEAAKYEAEGAETDREYIAKYAEALGELVIG